MSEEITRHTYVLPDMGAWLEIGVEKGWCSFPTCSTHDLLAMTEEEDEMFDDGEDPCIPVVRLWDGEPHEQ